MSLDTIHSKTNSQVSENTPKFWSNALNTLRNTLATNLDSERGRPFQSEIDILEGLLEPHINGKAEREILIRSVAIHATITEQLISDVMYFGPSARPTAKRIRQDAELLRKQSPLSTVPLPQIIARIRGLNSRINDAIKKYNRKTLSQGKKQNSEEMQNTGRQYSELFAFIRELEYIERELKNGIVYDKKARLHTMKRIEYVLKLVSNPQYQDLSEGDQLFMRIEQICETIKALGQSQKIHPSKTEIKDRLIAIVEGVEKGETDQGGERNRENREQARRDILANYIQDILNSLRNVVSDGRSNGDGRFRQAGVSPFLSLLRDGIKRGSLDPMSLNWEEVISGFQPHAAYGKIMYNELTSYKENTDFNTAIFQLVSAIDRVTERANIECRVLKSTLREYLASNPPPTF